jgi:hypothetical protein
MTLIERRVITSDTPSTTFSSLGSFLDLIIYAQVRTTDSSPRILLAQANNDTATADYESQRLVGSNTTASALVPSTAFGGLIVGVATASGATANFYGFGRAEILDYRGANYKSALANSYYKAGTASTTQGVGTDGSFWKGTAPINSLTIVSAAGNIAAGSVISVYGR